MTSEYSQALEIVTKATQVYRKAKNAYLAHLIGDDEYLVARKAFFDAEAVFDVAFAKEAS